jgi:hypothetical protein
LTESNDDGNGVLVAGIEHLFGCQQVLGIHRYLADVDIKIRGELLPSTPAGPQTILGNRSRHLLPTCFPRHLAARPPGIAMALEPAVGFPLVVVELAGVE